MPHETPAVETVPEVSSESALVALESKLVMAAIARNFAEQDQPAA